jgi:hypothetical protein
MLTIKLYQVYRELSFQETTYSFRIEATTACVKGEHDVCIDAIVENRRAAVRREFMNI